MIVGSLLLILVAVGLLVAGVLSSSNALIIASIVATVIAAIVLIFGVRQSANAADDEDYEDVDAADSPSVLAAAEARLDSEPAESADDGDQVDVDGEAAVTSDEPVVGAIPTQGRGGEQLPADGSLGQSAAADDDPPDEPSAQVTTPADAARIAMLTTEVLVIDGRPRYHIDGCVHLLGREFEPLPAGEALELGFSPCGMCLPDSALLAEARRG